MSNCRECGHLTESIRDIGSAVCTNCGTLVDSSQQSALTSSTDFLNDIYSPSNYSHPTTLKSIRRNPAWDLQGQGTNSRNERNKVILFGFLLSSPLIYHRRFPVRYPRIHPHPCRPSGTTWCSSSRPSDLRLCNAARFPQMGSRSQTCRRRCSRVYNQRTRSRRSYSFRCRQSLLYFPTLFQSSHIIALPVYIPACALFPLSSSPIPLA